MDRRLVALILGLLAAGCGGSDREDYEKDYRPLDRKLVRLGDDVGQTIATAPQTPDRDLARKLGELADRTGDFERELDDLDPPDDLQPDHERLVASVGKAEDGLERVEKAVAAGNRQGAGEATVRLVETSRELLEAQREVNRLLLSDSG
jgi:hypothetical protein